MVVYRLARPVCDPSEEGRLAAVGIEFRSDGLDALGNDTVPEVCTVFANAGEMSTMFAGQATMNESRGHGSDVKGGGEVGQQSAGLVTLVGSTIENVAGYRWRASGRVQQHGTRPAVHRYVRRARVGQLTSLTLSSTALTSAV